MDFGMALDIDAQGRPVITGYSQNASLDEDLVVWRYR